MKIYTCSLSFQSFTPPFTHTHTLPRCVFFLACLPVLKAIPTEQMNNIHDSTASIQHVTVVLVCPPELLVALVKISSLLLQLFGSSSPRVPIILEGNIYLTLLRLFPFLLLMRCLISLLGLCIIHSLFLLVRNYVSKMSKQQGFDYLDRIELFDRCSECSPPTVVSFLVYG